jgi:signal transduction histidine kinase
MLRNVIISVFASLSIASTGIAFAQGKSGTSAEAKAMLEKAVIELKASEATALAKFNKGEAGFKDRDLYVFCYDMNTGKFTAGFPALIGTDIKALKEKDGSPLGEKLFEATKPGTITTVTYKFPKPGTTDPVKKESYVTRVGDQGCGVGYFPE